MSDTSVLEVVTRKVTYRGGTLNVAPLKIGQIPAFGRVIRPMFSALANVLTSAPSDGDGGGSGDTARAELLVDAEELISLIGDHGDALIDAVVIATGMPREEIADGNPAEFIDLLVAVVEVNADFFARAVAKARKARAKPGPGTGLTPSRS